MKEMKRLTYCRLCKGSYPSGAEKFHGEGKCDAISKRGRSAKTVAITPEQIRAEELARREEAAENRRSEAFARRMKFLEEHAPQAGAYGRSRRH